jgi:hypothetical protein
MSASDAYVIQTGGETAGIVVRDQQDVTYCFFASARRFYPLEGYLFCEPFEAEQAAKAIQRGQRPPRPSAPEHQPRQAGAL